MRTFCTGGEPALTQFSPAYRWYALTLLVVVYIFNFIDRSILGILVQPIKEDLGVSDTMMGFLGGIAFMSSWPQARFIVSTSSEWRRKKS